MSDVLTLTCTGTNPAEAQTVLNQVAAEIRRRADVCAEAGAERWNGPRLHLTVTHLSQLAADEECLNTLAWILRTGRKVGVTGVVHDGDGSRVAEFENTLIRDLIADGRGLRWEPGRPLTPSVG